MTYYAADEVWRGNLPTPTEGRVAILRLMRDEQSMKHDPPSVSCVLRTLFWDIMYTFVLFSMKYLSQILFITGY